MVARLVYEGSGAAAIAEAQAAIHVNTFGERNHNFLLGVLAVILFVAPLAYGVVSSDWKVWTIVVAIWAILLLVGLLLHH